MKFGYTCKCGWRLSRTDKTRLEYAYEKMKHALGKRMDEKLEGNGCQELERELRKSGSPGLQP